MTPNSGIKDRILSFTRAMEAKDVADLLNIKEGSVYKQARAGAIPSFRIGTSVRFDPKKVADWYDGQ